MATYTTNYNLIKPGANDPVDIADLNNNADTIDASMYAIEDIAVANLTSIGDLGDISFTFGSDLVGAVNTLYSVKMPQKPPAIQFGTAANAGNGGYIDFFYNAAVSHTSRIIEPASGTIQIEASTLRRMQGGTAYQIIDASNIGSQTVAYAGGSSAARFTFGASTANRAAIVSDTNQRMYLYASPEDKYIFFGVGSDSAWHFMPMNFSPTLGSSTRLWGQIYSTNATISTSDRETKEDIQSLDPDYCKDIVMALNPCSFKFKDGTSGRTHFGMIAQDIEDTIKELNIDSKDFAPLVKSSKTEIVDVKQRDGSTIKEERKIDGYIYGLRYEEFIAPMIKVIQTQQTEIETLKADIEALKGGK